jgi:hypothetical protein
VGSREKNARETRARGRPFATGNSGRPKGVPNKVTREVRAFSRGILEDPLVQARIRLDAQKGRLAPPVLTMLFHYAYGKPKESIELKGGLEQLVVRILDEPRHTDAPASETRPFATDHGGHDDGHGHGANGHRDNRHAMTAHTHEESGRG